MPEDVIGGVWAVGWGALAGAGAFVGAVLGLVARLRHRGVAATMALGAGVLLSLASLDVASEALAQAGATATAAGIVGGAATFSAINAVLASARHRKRCGECQPQPSEADAPGSGSAIALGTALDAVPEAMILGISLRTGGPDIVMIVAIALSNLPEALSGTSGMRLASRSTTYVLSLWTGIALGTAVTTMLAFWLLGDLGTNARSILEAYGAGALIAMAAETMLPEAFHKAPRYSGVLAAAGFAALILFGELAAG